jgi:hypothetical protein
MSAYGDVNAGKPEELILGLTKEGIRPWLPSIPRIYILVQSVASQPFLIHDFGKKSVLRTLLKEKNIRVLPKTMCSEGLPLLHHVS